MGNVSRLLYSKWKKENSELFAILKRLECGVDDINNIEENSMDMFFRLFEFFQYFSNKIDAMDADI
jgi:hypothetical protein